MAKKMTDEEKEWKFFSLPLLVCVAPFLLTGICRVLITDPNMPKSIIIGTTALLAFAIHLIGIIMAFKDLKTDPGVGLFGIVFMILNEFFIIIQFGI